MNAKQKRIAQWMDDAKTIDACLGDSEKTAYAIAEETRLPFSRVFNILRYTENEDTDNYFIGRFAPWPQDMRFKLWRVANYYE